MAKESRWAEKMLQRNKQHEQGEFAKDFSEVNVQRHRGLLDAVKLAKADLTSQLDSMTADLTALEHQV